MTSSSDIAVRVVPCEAPDFTALLSAFEAELEERYPGISEDELAETPELALAVVAYRGEVPVGCGALRELEPEVGEVKRVFVAPEARGLGAARRMLDVLEAQGRALGYRVLRLGTGVRQPEAVALYESSGYVRIPLFGEYQYDELCVCYEKALG